MRRALIALMVLSIATPSIAGAQADEKLGGYKDSHQAADGTVTLVAERDGSVRQPRTGGGRLDCRVHDLQTDVTPLAVGAEAVGLEEGIGYWLLCDDAGGERVVSRLFTYEPGVAAISPEELAARARSQLPLAYPEPQTSPAVALDQIVGIDTWMWIDPAAWQPISATASIPGLSITATATPESMTWDMGDGTVVSCDGPGTPYDETRPEAEQSTDCSHLYQARGAYTATATITWSISWSSSDGGGGQLADASRTTEFTMSVAERQAIGQ